MSVVVALESRLPDVSRVDRWLYAGHDAAWRIKAEAGPLASLPRLDVADRLQETAWRLREPFAEWVGELGRRNDSLEWWASQLAARTSYTRLFERICMLAVARDTLATQTTGTTLVVCSSPALASEIARREGAAAFEPPAAQKSALGPLLTRAWTRFAPLPLHGAPARLRPGAQFVVDQDPRHRHAVLRRHRIRPRPFGGPGTVLLVTWVDGRSFRADGGYVDPHLGPLAEMLRERGLTVAHLAHVLPSIAYADAVRRLAASDETFLLPDAYLSLDDHRLSARRASAFVPAIDPAATVAGVPVAALAAEHIEEHRASQASYLVHERLLRRFAEHEVRPERLVHPCEGHAWELVLAWAARRHLPDTTVVGYENLNMSRLALSMYPARAERGIRPLPDRLVANGPAFRDVLVSEGWAETVVRAGCGLRHEALWHHEPSGRGHESGGPPLRVLVAGEITLGPSVELADKAIAAFAEDPGVELTMKCHPLLPRSQVTRALGSRADALRFDDRPMLGQLADADLLLYTYTAVCVEALALGVPPVFIRSDSTLDLDQLEV
ncbi:MAG: hypothetical protein ACRDLK_07195, partial [Gaiellaceae bacterium]